jgi:hypothetical protein
MLKELLCAPISEVLSTPYKAYILPVNDRMQKNTEQTRVFINDGKNILTNALLIHVFVTGFDIILSGYQ